MLDSLQVTMGACVLHPTTQGAVFAPSAYIFALEIQYLPWKCSVQHKQRSSKDPISQGSVNGV